MKRKRFKVPIYNFNITFIEMESATDCYLVAKEMKRLNCTPEAICSVSEALKNGDVNGGETYRNMPIKEILVLIYPCTSERRRREVVNHEKRHIEDRILEYLGINDIEASAYLAGFLSEHIF